MKKLKYAVLLFMVFLLSGCIDVSMNIKIKNDDTGVITYKVGYEKSFYESSNATTDTSIKDTIPEAKVEDIEYQKGDSTYIGQKATITFDSIDKLNDILTKLNESSEEEDDSLNNDDTQDEVLPGDTDTQDEDLSGDTDTQDEVLPGDADTQDDSSSSNISTPPVTVVRKDDTIKIELPADKASYEQSKAYLSYVDYSFSVTLDTKATKNNADKVDEKTHTYTWTISTLLKKGVNLEYKTSHNYLILGSIAVVYLAVIVLLIKTIKAFIKKKQ